MTLSLSRSTACAFLWSATLAIAGCGDAAPPDLFGTSSDGGTSPDLQPDCTSPCTCADRGPPDFSREMNGTPAPSGDETQNTALIRANHWRTGIGLSPFNANDKIQMASSAHAQYLANDPQATCWPMSPHYEVKGCGGFTGVGPGDRLTTAGYQWDDASEVIDEGLADENTAVDWWVWSVYHRLPFVNDQLLETGFGYAKQWVMDFGAAPNAKTIAATAPLLFPLPGLTGVPTSFRGDTEGPTPPAPGGGSDPWPQGVSSGAVVSMHFPNGKFTITDHHLYENVGGMCMDVPHTFNTAANDPNLKNLGPNSVFLYANDPLDGATEYVVVITGTWDGSAFTRSWAFTTM